MRRGLETPSRAQPIAIPDADFSQEFLVHEAAGANDGADGRQVARATGLSQSAVMRIRHAFGPQPHRAETFKL